MSNPYFSILITTKNRKVDLAFTLSKSVHLMDREDVQWIICDDGSMDNTMEIARNFEKIDSRIKVNHNKINLGDYPNRNHAASYANGKYLKYLDSDDVMYYFGLEVMVRFTEMFPAAGFGLGAYPDDNKPFPVFLTPREIYLEHFYKFSHFDRAPGSGLIKREAFNKIGGFFTVLFLKGASN